MIIVFEGLDKTGKTTLRTALHESTNYENVIFDRGPWSNMFYDLSIHRYQLSKKEAMYRFYEHANDAFAMSMSVGLIVYCQSNFEMCKQRHKNAKENIPTHIDTEEKYNISKDAFFKIVKYYRDPETRLLQINTDKDIEHCVDKIINKIKEIKGGDV